MGRIYQSCVQAIVYLGDDLVSRMPGKQTPPVERFFADDRDIARIEKARCKLEVQDAQVGRSHRKAYRHEIDDQKFTASDVFTLIRRLTDDEHVQKMNSFLRVPPLLEALRRLMNPPWTPWWTRMWVLQECTLPKDVLMVYGGVSAPWEMFVAAARNIAKHSGACCADFAETYPRDLWRVLTNFCSQVNDVQELRRAHSNSNLGCPKRDQEERQGMTLLHLLQKFRHRRASDPRDKVYALLSLVRTNGKKPAIIPDYSLSERDVYIQATLEIISDTESFAVISTSTGRKYRNDLPSWVPDWDAPSVQSHDLRAEAIHLYRAFGLALHPRFDVLPKATLRVHATYLGEIQEIQEVMWGDSPGVSRQTLSNWWKAFNRAFDKIPGDVYPEDQGSRDAFWKLVCAGVFCWQSSSEPQGKVRCLARPDEITFVSWAVQSPRSPFSNPLMDPTFTHGEVDNGLSQLAKAWECMLYLEKYRLPWSLDDLWGTNTTSAQAVEQLLQGTNHTYLSKLVEAFIPYWRESMMDSASKKINSNAPWKEFFQEIKKKMWEYYGETWHTNIKRETRREAVAAMDFSIMTTTLSRRLFHTREGRLGLAPADAQRGDFICYVQGGEAPFVLRQGTATQAVLPHFELANRSYQLVGDCYLLGMNEGYIESFRVGPPTLSEGMIDLV